MNQQTIPLLMDFKDILDGKTSIFYSTGNAGGMNFWGVFLFFLASPLYLSVKFVEKSQLIYLVNILLVIKLMLAGFTASYYFKKCHKKLKTEINVVLSVMYALCGFGIMYCQTLVWLDIMALFPVFLMSVDRLCRKGKAALYGICLSVMMIINFYLSYMLVVYILLSVPLCIGICTEKGNRKYISFKFLFSSIISALVTAPVWLCAFLQISSSARGEGAFSEIANDAFFKNGANKFAVIMCTAFCIVILLFFIKNKICRIKQVKYHLCLLGLLVVPVFIDPINKMWHTGSYQSFPLRYGYIIVFTMLVLTAVYFENVKEYGKNSKVYVITAFSLAVSFVALCFYVVYSKEEQLSSYTNSLTIDGKAFKILFLMFLTACFMYIVCICIQRKKLINSRTLSAVLLVVFFGEAILSLSVNIGYASGNGGVLKTSQTLEYDSSNQPYYRTKTEKKYLHVNMLGGLGYNALSHYTSLTNEEYMFAMKKLGYSSYWMEVGSHGGTVLSDALMAVKYSIGTSVDLKSYYDITELSDKLERKKGTSEICCPVGILKDDLSEDSLNISNGSRVDVQKQFAENFFGTSKMIYEYNPDFTADGSFEYDNSKYGVTVKPDEKGLCQMRYSIDIKDNQVLYFDIFDNLSNNLGEIYYNSAEVYVNGNNIALNYPTQKNNGLLCLGEFKNTTVEILIIIKKDISVKSMGVFGIDTDILKECTDNIKGCDFYVNGSSMTAECTLDKNQYLYMSVPYDKGLTAYVNGEKAELIKTNDAFSCLKLSKGVNKIEIKFMPYGFKISVFMAISGILLMFVYKFLNKRNIYKYKVLTHASYVITVVLFAAVIAFIYLLPVIIKIAMSISNLII